MTVLVDTFADTGYGWVLLEERSALGDVVHRSLTGSSDWDSARMRRPGFFVGDGWKANMANVLIEMRHDSVVLR